MLAASVLEQCGDLVLYLRKDLRLLWVNPGGLRLLGLPALSPDADLSSLVHPEDLPAIRAAIDRCGPREPATSLVLRATAASGEAVFLNVRVLHDDACGHLLLIGHDVTASQMTERRLRYMATHDPLTGLANRSALEDRLEQAVARARRTGEAFALVLADLDGFKKINDSLGHEAGDAVLKGVATRMRAAVRDTDTVARLGGDEFALLLTDVDPSGSFASVSTRLLQAIGEPVCLHGNTLRVTGSLGIAVYPAHAKTLAALRAYADIALYRAKGAGKDCYCLFTDEMLADATEQSVLEKDLTEAVRRGEFYLQYQPIVDVRRRPVAFEALMRWDSPDRGQVSPALFVPAAERAGLMPMLGGWALKIGANFAAQMGAAGMGVQVSVNVSARQLKAGHLVRAVDDALRLTRLPAERLQLEITESALMADPEGALKTLQALREMGCGVALDDFGTGYSSLSYLSRFPLTALKIDASFVQQAPACARHRSIVQAVLRLGQDLGLSVTAEGVETEEQFELLRGLGCQSFQGWLFGRADFDGRIKNVYLRKCA
jgi:diguanylate cyclase (GGDEF)-like protein